MKNKYLFFHLFILLFLLGLNTYIYLHRDEGYAYAETLSYEELYTLGGKAWISDMHEKAGDSLTVDIKNLPEACRWKINRDSSGSFYESARPCLSLKPGKHIYTLQATPLRKQKPIQLGINYTPSEVYKASGRERNSVAELYSSSVPVGICPKYSLEDWQHSSPFSKPHEQNDARILLRNVAQMDPLAPALLKLKSTGLFILQSLDSSKGIPSDTMDLLSPFQRYACALAGRSKVWCGDLSGILSFFLKAQHIYSREVCLQGKTGDVYRAGHSFNEVYLPELDQWVLSDLTSGAWCFNYQGRYLNALDLYQLHKNNVQGIEAFLIREGHTSMMPYDSVKTFYDYYFNNAPKFVYYLNKQYNKDLYSFGSKVKRYFFKDATFVSFAGTSANDNHKFYFKQAVAIALLAFVLYLLALGSINTIVKQKNRR